MCYSLGCLSSLSWKMADWALADCNSSRPSSRSLALLGLFLSPWMGNWTCSLDKISILCDFSDFAKMYHHWPKGIDPSLQEAGIAFGMTRMGAFSRSLKFTHMPVIMSGIRTKCLDAPALACLLDCAGGLVPLSFGNWPQLPVRFLISSFFAVLAITF